MHLRFRAIQLLPWFASLGLNPISAAAVDGTWIAGPGLWSDATNWSSAPQFPSAGGEAFFGTHRLSGSTGTITLDTSVQLSRLTTANTRYMQLISPSGGNTLELVGPAEVHVENPLIWVGGFFFPRPGFWLRGGVTGTTGLTKTGAGEMVLTETNTFSGGLHINAGSVFARTDASLGAPGQPIFINGGTLSSYSNPPGFDTSRTIYVGANGGTFHAYASAPTYRGDMIGNSTATFQSTLLVQGNSWSFRVAGNQSFSGDIRVFTFAEGTLSTGTLSDAGAWSQARSLQVAGRLALDNGTIANSNRLSDGTVTLSSGTLIVRGNDATAINEHAGVLVADGFGQLTAGTSGAQPVHMTFSGFETRNGGALAIGTLNGSSTIRFDVAPALIGTGTFGTTSAPVAPLISVNAVHTYDATTGVRPLRPEEYITTLPTGVTSLNVAVATTELANSPVTVNSLELRSGGSITATGTLTIASGVIASSTGSGSHALQSPVNFGSARGIVSGTVDLVGPISGTAGISLINGKFSLPNNSGSTYTGLTAIHSATLTAVGVDVRPGQPGPFGMDDTAIVMSDATLIGSGTIARALSVNSSAGSHSRIEVASGSLNLTGKISGDGTLAIGPSSGTLTMSGEVSGPLKLFMLGSTNVRLTGDNSFSNGVFLDEPSTLIVASDTALGTGSILAFRGSLQSEGGVRTLQNRLVISSTGSLTINPGSQFVFAGPVELDTVSTIYSNLGARVRFDQPVFVSGFLRAHGSGTLTLGSPNSFDRALEIGDGARVVTDLPSRGATRIARLQIYGEYTAPLGTLDLTDDDLVLTDHAITDVVSLTAHARNGGAWNDLGITSSAARENPLHNTTLGVISGAEYRALYGPRATFDGFALTDSDVLVQYTYYGDTDFNESVNFDDYARIDAGFNNDRSGWMNGDFDLNGTINFDDYALIDLAFNTQGAPLRAVPEPASLTLLGGLAASAVSCSRRRRAC